MFPRYPFPAYGVASHLRGLAGLIGKRFVRARAFTFLASDPVHVHLFSRPDALCSLRGVRGRSVGYIAEKSGGSLRSFARCSSVHVLVAAITSHPVHSRHACRSGGAGSDVGARRVLA